MGQACGVGLSQPGHHRLRQLCRGGAEGAVRGHAGLCPGAVTAQRLPQRRAGAKMKASVEVHGPWRNAVNGGPSRTAPVRTANVRSRMRRRARPGRDRGCCYRSRLPFASSLSTGRVQHARQAGEEGQWPHGCVGAGHRTAQAQRGDPGRSVHAKAGGGQRRARPSACAAPRCASDRRRARETCGLRRRSCRLAISSTPGCSAW